MLRVSKGGAKLKEAAAVDTGHVPATITGRNGGVVAASQITVRNDQANSRMICTGATIADFLFRLGANGAGQILDQTGLTGRYDFTLDYGNYMKDSDPEHRLNAITEARFDAMRAELGLEVVEAKMSVDTLVVDRAGKTPTQN